MKNKTMKNKAIIVLAGVFVVSVLAVVALTQMTGFSFVDTRYCECHIVQYDYYGNAINDMVQPLRVRSFEAYTDAACNERCGQHFGRVGNVRTKSVWGQTNRV